MKLIGVGLLGFSVGYAFNGRVKAALLSSCGLKHEAIRERNPLITLGSATLSAVASVSVANHFSTLNTACMMALLLTWGLLLLSLIDSGYLLLPDIIVIPLWSLGIAVNFFHVFTSLTEALLGSVFGYFILTLIATLYHRRTQRVGLGLGDVKLYGLLGAWFGINALPHILLIASISALLFGLVYLNLKRQSYQSPIPFGPFLGVAGWCQLLNDTSASLL